MKVFLGGTCGGSNWREELIPMLDIDYFNPVVPDWDAAAYAKELNERVICDFCLYVITPDSHSMYSIAEVVDDSNKRPDRTIFCYVNTAANGNTFDEGKLKSLRAIGKMVVDNGGVSFDNLGDVAKFLNGNEI